MKAHYVAFLALLAVALISPVLSQQAAKTILTGVNTPHDVAIDPNTRDLYVADSYNHR